MRKILFFVFALLVSLMGIQAYADEIDYEDFYDFKVDGIYYDILSEEEKTVEVIDPAPRWGAETGLYCGNLIVPPTVEYDGTTYLVTSFMSCYYCPVMMISLPSTIEYVCQSAVSNLSHLVYLQFPDNIESLPGPACCEELTVFNIPASVRTIEVGSFQSVGLNTLWIPQNVKTIEDFCIIRNESLEYVLFSNEVSNGDVVMSTVETIGSHCFSDNPVLQYAMLPNTLISMGEDCFNDCPSLRAVSLPPADLKLSNCFNGCPSICTIMVNAEEPYPFPDSSFVDVNRDACKLMVPAGSEELYRNAEGWKDFYEINGSESLGVSAAKDLVPHDGRAYNLDGTPKPDDEKGIAIQDGKVIIRK